MAPAKILIAGIGNIFMGDDAFGCEVAQRLAARSWPAGVRVTDFGIRGLDLAYALLEEYDAVILIDAVPRGKPPGTLFVIEPDLAQLGEAAPAMPDAHCLDPVKILNMAKSLGGDLKNLLLVGCEPADLGSFEGKMGLSDPVAGALNDAMTTVERLVVDLLNCPPIPTALTDPGTLTDSSR